ncbi:MAG: DUF6088 family protein [Terriglobia bacterium]
MNSIAAAILKRIRVHGRGWVFTPRDFLDLGTRHPIDLALSRFASDKTIRRLTQGVYDYPRVHKKLGVLAPNPDEVAAVLAAKTGSRMQVSGARAANLLGLTDQVPAQLVYLTDGPSHRVKIGAQIIRLKPASPSKFPGAGTPAGLAIQAIRAVGPNASKDFVVRQLSRALSARDRAQLAKLIKYAPGWSHEIIRQLKGT